MTVSRYGMFSVTWAAFTVAGLTLVAQSGQQGDGSASNRPNLSEPDFSPKPPVRPLSPAEQAKRFWLPPGFKIEPVLSEPLVEEPGQIAFDGNGRMFVVELRGYMQDRTLEGLDAADARFVRAMMKATDPQIRIQAIRVSETLFKAGDRSFADDYQAMAKDADPDVVIQALMTHNILKISGAAALVRATLAVVKTKGVQLVGNTILNPPRNVAGGRGGIRPDGLPEAFTGDEQAVMQAGEMIYTELCFACHAPDGRGEPVAGGKPGKTRAPSLAASPRVIGHRDYVVKTILHGVTGPIDGERYDDVMVPLGVNSDEWVAAVGSYIRNAFGNRSTFVTPADVARIRAATRDRTAMWTVEEIAATLPRLVIRDPGWKVTASHRPEAASSALSFEPWHSGVPQEPDMWLQIELSRAVLLTEIYFESAAQRAGGRGTGAPGDPGSGTISVNYGGPPPPLGSIGYPRGYQVTVSTDGVNWSAPVAQASGTGSQTVIAFAPVHAKFVRLTQTAAVENAPPLSIQLLRLYEASQPARSTSVPE